jgi:hypothetical protein
MSYSTADIYGLLTEMPMDGTKPFSPRNFAVDYYVFSPRGSKARFQRTSGINQIRNAMSETAVYFYLKKFHPGCDIQIQSLEWK